MDRSKEARNILVEYYSGGDQNSLLVEHELVEISATLLAENDAASSASYFDMFKTPGNRKRLFILVTIGIYSNWVGNGVVSYYLALVLDTVGITGVSEQTLISGCLQIWNLIVCSVAVSSVDKLGYRTLFLSSAAIMLVSYIIITGLSGSFASTGTPSVGVAVIPFLFVFFAGFGLAL